MESAAPTPLSHKARRQHRRALRQAQTSPQCETASLEDTAQANVSADGPKEASQSDDKSSHKPIAVGGEEIYSGVAPTGATESVGHMSHETGADVQPADVQPAMADMTATPESSSANGANTCHPLSGDAQDVPTVAATGPSTRFYTAKARFAHEVMTMRVPYSDVRLKALKAVKNDGFQVQYEWEATPIHEALCRLGLGDDAKIDEVMEVVTKTLQKGLQQSIDALKGLGADAINSMDTMNATAVSRGEELAQKCDQLEYALIIERGKLAQIRRKLDQVQQELRNLKASTQGGNGSSKSYELLMAQFQKLGHEHDQLQRLYNEKMRLWNEKMEKGNGGYQSGNSN